MKSASHLLVVEDEEIVAEFIKRTLCSHGYHVTCVADAEAAWQRLNATHDFDTVLLDRGLPGMNGIELLKKIKEDPVLRQIPVIMETSQDDVESVKEGLAAGAYYYLPKPLHPELLMAVIHAALTQRHDYESLQESIRQSGRTLTYLDCGTFKCRTVAEARELAQGLARGCPDPLRSGLGLQELLVNAVEHGNLGITYNEKTQLMLEEQWGNEVARRESDPAYAGRKVTVTFLRDTETLRLTIQDEGIGFDWQKYLEFSPERAFDPHGRGIALARMTSFDSIEYLAK